jgi:hypothetical protein
MPTVKEDFAWLFQDHPDELKKLTARFPLRDFNFMITSQRSIEQIYRKLRRIDEGKITGREHGNFWPDLRALGLASPDRQELSELGQASLEYFGRVKDDFKREHFVLSAIGRGAYDVPKQLRDDYLEKIQNLWAYLKRIPRLNIEGRELLRNEEKLFFTECLNAFPLALERYFELPRTRQDRLDSLHESRLKTMFHPNDPEEAPYAKTARRFLNVWRALNRRTNFVRSVILSHYEDNVDKAPNNSISLTIERPYRNILNQKLLLLIIKQSDRITFDQSCKELCERVKRPRRARIIVDPAMLTKSWLLKQAGKSMQDLTDMAEREQARRALLEKRTKDHQEIVRTIVTKLYAGKEDLILKDDQYSFDLLVEKKSRPQAILHEVKTNKRYNRADERHRVVEAVGQLFYYEHFNVPFELENKSAKTAKFVVFQNSPDNDHVVYLKRCGIEVLWLRNGDIDGEHSSLELLRQFVSSGQGTKISPTLNPDGKI